MEEWRDVPGFDGRLQASTLGRIRRIHVLKQRPRAQTGYLVCGVPGDVENHSRHEHVHTLVAAAFLGPRPQGFQVNHKDGDRENPRPENLEYVTPTENSRHGVRRRMACLSDDKIQAVDEAYYVLGKSCRKISMELDVSIDHVRRYVQLCRIEQGRKKGKYEHKLDAAARKRMIELRAQGLSVREISKMFNVSESHTSRTLRGLSTRDTRILMRGKEQYQPEGVIVE
jgi:transposase